VNKKKQKNFIRSQPALSPTGSHVEKVFFFTPFAWKLEICAHRTEARQGVTKDAKEEGKNTKEIRSAAPQIANGEQLRVLAFCFVSFVTPCLPSCHSPSSGFQVDRVFFL
jgi:hypothetical protein